MPPSVEPFSAVQKVKLDVVCVLQLMLLSLLHSQLAFPAGTLLLDFQIEAD